MSDSVSHWLPEEAFGEAAVKSVLAEAVARWSECWFAHEAVSISTAQIDPGGTATLAGQNIRVDGVFASAELFGSGKRRLLEAALDIDLSKQTLNDKDHRLLDALATQIAQDLIARLEKFFGNENAGRAGAMLHATLSMAGNIALAVALPRHLLVPMLKARFGGVRPPRGTFASRLQALEPTQIMAEGLLGRAELTMDDLKDLSPGDVLVLDKSLHEPVELRLTGSNRHLGAGRLVQNGSQISIQL